MEGKERREGREGREGDAPWVVEEVEALGSLRQEVGRVDERVGRAFGAWAGRADLDEVWLTQGRERWWSRWVGGLM